jgi:hypothetical protein
MAPSVSSETQLTRVERTWRFSCCARDRVIGPFIVCIEVMSSLQCMPQHGRTTCTFPWGSGPTVATLEYIVSSWSRGGPGAAHAEGSGAVHRATRDSRAGTVSSYCSKGYPLFRVLTVAPGPTSGEDTSLQVGPKLDRRLARCFRALAVVITVSPSLVSSTATPVSAVD